jgi:dTDP-3-amino-3,4,6-trideoxy-alpha-D-glucose transaminase
VVPLVDLTRRAAVHRDNYLAAVERILSTGTFLLGPELEGFEHEFAAWAGYRHTVAVSSGAAALQLALAALGVEAGDEVIVPAFTAVPTASAVCALGATPVPVDVDDDTAALDLDATVAAVTARTRAIVPVHLYGRPAAVPSCGPAVLEDAAQAHGALRHHGASAAVAYSFYPTKNLGGVGDGGAVVTDDPAIADALRRRRVHGMTTMYVHTEIAQNFRMSELEAAWLRLTLPDLAIGNDRRRAIASRYRAASPHLRWHADHPDHVHHLAVVRVDDRARFRSELHDAGVATAVHYPLALTQQPAYRRFARDACPVAERWSAECVSVPMFPELTDDEVGHVCDVLAASKG